MKTHVLPGMHLLQFPCWQELPSGLMVSHVAAGGDLCSAIERDADGELKWHRDGHHIALDIAKGLYFLHSHDVRTCASAHPDRKQTVGICRQDDRVSVAQPAEVAAKACLAAGNSSTESMV